MAIYQMAGDDLAALNETTFGTTGIREREDLQRLLRDRIHVIAPDTMVIAEEFGEWEDSRRRIDLLALDKEANLVVIELKRTEDGGHMELQALRYAAMVSTLTFERCVEVYRRYLNTRGQDDDAQTAILEFLEWDEPDEEQFAQEVRIVLASAEFSKELTTAVMWLNDRALDIRCVRLKPYTDGERLLLDVQQVIPLPEAEQYQVQLREKTRREKSSRRSERDFTKFDVTVDGTFHAGLNKRQAVYTVLHHLFAKGLKPTDIDGAITFRKTNWCRSVPGEVLDEAEFIEKATEAAEAEGRRFESKRYYTAPDELIVCDGRTYAISNQWGGRAQEWMDQVLEKYGTQGVSYALSQ